ncbi:MAG: DUF2207 domain-containing protein [Longimicrobiales bacterium]|nr:DUF2207 domain-containing protein [Longimicrobiales bacterium]
MIRLLILIPSLLLAPVSAGPATAQEQEEILEYDVDMDVGDGGVLRVLETITVRALGDRIRRGIYRDVPTGFPGWAGLHRIEAPFRVLSVARNGLQEPYTVEAIGGPEGREGARVRIGSPDVRLRPGIHEYAIEYETSRWVDFGDEVDRLYWNVTGNGWAFPIRSASARVRLPGLDEPPELESWTGPPGSTTTTATGRWSADSATAVFTTEETLGPGDGLTIRVTLPAGVITPPTEAQRAEWFRLDWGGWIEGGYLVLLVVAVYLLMWRRVGMDPPAGRTGPRDEPPAGYSPAALGFIEERGYEERQLSAALVSLARKGAIRLEEDGATWSIERRADPAELDEPLSPEEEVLFRRLLSGRDRIRLQRSHHATFRTAIRDFRSSLRRRLEREYFVTNRRWFLTGMAVSFIGFAVLCWRWRFDIDPTALFLGFWLTGWTAGVGTLGYRFVQAVRSARSGGSAALWGQAGFLALFSLPFLGAEIFVAGLLLTMVPNHLVAAAIVVGGVNVLFYHLLERPTLKGRGVLDELDAFRAHLTRASRRFGDRAPMGDREIRVYERLLPFAIALGVERPWTEAFESALSPALASGTDARPLHWYARSGEAAPTDASRFASALSTGLPGTLSSLSSPPSSSGGGSGGGFSGGGSSGGGGGGGGGGGW